MKSELFSVTVESLVSFIGHAFSLAVLLFLFVFLPL